MSRTARSIALLLALGALLALPPGPAAAQTTVDVSLTDPGTKANPVWGVFADPDTASAGEVTFEVANDSPFLPHDFHVVATDLPADGLPVSGFVVDEDDPQVDFVASIEEFPAEESRTLVTTLDGGNYVLICNLANHYEQGMYAAFQVTGQLPTDTPSAEPTDTPVSDGTPVPTGTTGTAAATPAADELPATGAAPQDGTAGGWLALALLGAAAALSGLGAVAYRRTR